ncbi:MAG: CoA-binding protein, partial [Nitrospinaceae bacterium]|nr:CoA-binding protein [Nitrospinaceae bacterium]
SLLGERCYPSLSALPAPPEMVNVFRQSRFVSGLVDEAIALGTKALWLQKGVVDEEAARRAEAAGLAVVMDL